MQKKLQFWSNYPFKMSFCVRVGLVWSSQCVTNCMLCLRAVTAVDVDPDLVHMEIQDIGGGKEAHVFIEQCISIQFYIPHQTTANKGRWDVLGLQFCLIQTNLFQRNSSWLSCFVRLVCLCVWKRPGVQMQTVAQSSITLKPVKVKRHLTVTLQPTNTYTQPLREVRVVSNQYEKITLDTYIKPLFW